MFWIAVLLLVSAPPYQLSANLLSNQSLPKTGKLKGNVVTSLGSVFPQMTVVIEGQNSQWEIVTDRTGAYEVDLPEGIYKLSTKKVEGWIPFKRAAFRVKAGNSLILNIVLDETHFDADCNLYIPHSNVLIDVQTGETTHTDPQFQGTLDKEIEEEKMDYEAFSLPNSSEPELDLFVRFNQRQECGNVIEYKKVMVSYNALTVYADHVRFGRKLFELKASGNVILEDGQQQFRLAQVEVRFKEGHPLVVVPGNSKP